MSLGDEYKKAAIQFTKDLTQPVQGEYFRAFTGRFSLHKGLAEEVEKIARSKPGVLNLTEDIVLFEMDDEYAFFVFERNPDGSSELATYAVVHEHGGNFAEPPIAHFSEIYNLIFRYGRHDDVVYLAGTKLWRAATMAQLSQVYGLLSGTRMPLMCDLPCFVIDSSHNSLPPGEDSIVTKSKLESMLVILNGK